MYQCFRASHVYNNLCQTDVSAIPAVIHFAVFLKGGGVPKQVCFLCGRLAYCALRGQLREAASSYCKALQVTIANYYFFLHCKAY